MFPFNDFHHLANRLFVASTSYMNSAGDCRKRQQSEWDGVELMLLTRSWGWYEEATDARSALFLYMRLQHSPHEVWNINSASSVLLFVNKERAVSSSWLHRTVHVGSLTGSYQTVLQRSARSWGEDGVWVNRLTAALAALRQRRGSSRMAAISARRIFMQ